MNQIPISREAMAELMRLTTASFPSPTKTVGELYFEEAKRQMQEVIIAKFVAV